MILELGGNDGLRALPIAQMRANLAQMIDLGTAAGAKVLLLGMRMPPNYGPRIHRTISAMVFSDLAAEKKIPAVPFLLDRYRPLPGLLMQNDDIHPNASGQPILLDNVWPALKPLLHK